MNKKPLTRIFHNYLTWEDFQHGMFNDLKDGSSGTRTQKAVDLLCSSQELFDSMMHVSNNWINAAEVNLSNRGCNRQAWLGQSACCYVNGTVEAETREAWGQLETSDRTKANYIADLVIDQWEVNHG